MSIVSLEKFIDATKYKENGRLYTGAGCIVMEMYNSQPVILLPRDQLRGQYIDFGGSIDMNEFTDKEKSNMLIITALRETYEESCALFGLNIHAFVHYADVDEYRCFFVCCGGETDMVKAYKHNRELMYNNNNYTGYFKETNDLVRISLKSLVNDGIMDCETKNFHDINGNPIEIHIRAVKILKEAIRKHIIIEAFNDPIVLIATKQPDNMITLVSV